MKLTLEEIRRRIEEIRADAGDDEGQHGAEDALHQAVLQAIANGTCEKPREAARLALETREIDFARWCA
jgi:hypothetical protein